MLRRKKISQYEKLIFIIRNNNINSLILLN